MPSPKLDQRAFGSAADFAAPPGTPLLPLVASDPSIAVAIDTVKALQCGCFSLGQGHPAIGIRVGAAKHAGPHPSAAPLALRPSTVPFVSADHIVAVGVEAVEPRGATGATLPRGAGNALHLGSRNDAITVSIRSREHGADTLSNLSTGLNAIARLSLRCGGGAEQGCGEQERLHQCTSKHGIVGSHVPVGG